MNITNTQKHKDVTSAVVTITPKLAEELYNNNPINRPLRVGGVEKITRDILGGKWVLNGQPIIIAKDGEVLDGQHRILAIIEAGVAVDCLLTRGIDKSTIPTIDSGVSRSWTDQYQIMNKIEGRPVQYATNLQAVLRNIHWYETAWPSLQSGRKKNASFTELNALLEQHPQLTEFVQHVCSRNMIKNLRSSSIAATVYALAAEKYPNEARGWLEVLKVGDTANPNNPAHVLREKLITRTLSNVAPLDINIKFVYFIKSWNAYVQGDEIASLRWGKDEPMPAIYGTRQYTGKYAAHTALHTRAVSGTKGEKSTVKRTGRRGK